MVQSGQSLGLEIRGTGLGNFRDYIIKDIEEVYVGSVVMNEVYVAEANLSYSLVHQRDQTQNFTLTSGEDVNLATWLSGQGAGTATPVIINFAFGEVIGGTVEGKPALDLGDLSAYSSITFNIDGWILGMAGNDALWAQDPIDIINYGGPNE